MTTPHAASRIAESVFGEPVRSCERFATGLRNFVYDVVLDSGRRAVVRCSRPEHREELAGGVFWSQQLASAGVPVAEVLAHDVHGATPYMVLERLPGTDLGNVIADLHDDDLAQIAASVGDMQRRTAALPQAGGFGYALNYGDSLEPSWLHVLDGQIDRAERWIRSAGVVDPDHVNTVRRSLGRQRSELLDIEPCAFLHDATTKNVIVSNGQVSGVVDVDTLAFGDPLWAVALTRMSLLSAGRPTTYADLLEAAMNNRDHRRLELYTQIFCLTFLGELGQRFNRDQAPAVDHDHRRRLEALLT